MRFHEANHSARRMNISKQDLIEDYLHKRVSLTIGFSEALPVFLVSEGLPV